MTNNNCKKCFLKIRKNQHILTCTKCSLRFHRTCFDKISPSQWKQFSSTWKCPECTEKSATSRNEEKCPDCNFSVPNNIICFNCVFPSISLHEEFDPFSIDPQFHLNRLFPEGPPTFKRGLQYAYQNVNGLPSKFDELNQFLQQNKNNIACFACGETKPSNSHPSRSLQIDGFTFLRNDRQSRKGGGTSIYINNDIPFVEISYDVSFPNEVEINSIKLFPKNRKPVVFISVYKPPHVNNNDFLSSFEALLFHVSKEQKYIIQGDFNINYQNEDAHSKELKNLAHRYQMEQIITSPTRTTETSSSLIDLVFVPKKNNIIQSGNFPLTHSDHDCIFAVDHFLRPKQQPRTIQCRDYKNTDFAAIKTFLKNYKWPDLNKNKPLQTAEIARHVNMGLAYCH
jgi:exonuclease III